MGIRGLVESKNIDSLYHFHGEPTESLSQIEFKNSSSEIIFGDPEGDLIANPNVLDEVNIESVSWHLMTFAVYSDSWLFFNLSRELKIL